MQSYLEVCLLFFIVSLDGFNFHLVFFDKFYNSIKNSVFTARTL